MKKIIIGLMLVSSLYSFDHLQFDKTNCNLVGAGTMNKQVVFQGEKYNGGCQSIVPAKIFFSKYDVCSISNIYYQKNYTKNIVCGFGYYDGNIKKSKIYFSNTSDGSCGFVCLKK